MKLRLLAPACIAFSLCLACQSAPATSPQQATASEPTAAEPAAVAPALHVLGAPLSAGEAVPVAQLIANPMSFQDKTLVVTGKVRATCKRSGCWMELTDPATGAGHFRVTFKDHAFIAPKDCVGKLARVEGTVVVATLPKDRVDHMEAMGATMDNKQPDGSALIPTLVATGAELRRD